MFGYTRLYDVVLCYSMLYYIGALRAAPPTGAVEGRGRNDNNDNDNNDNDNNDINNDNNSNSNNDINTTNSNSTSNNDNNDDDNNDNSTYDSNNSNNDDNDDNSNDIEARVPTGRLRVLAEPDLYAARIAEARYKDNDNKDIRIISAIRI